VLTLSDAADFTTDPRLRALYVAMAEETAAVAAAEGFDVGAELPGRLAHVGKFRHTPSMLQDLRKGRPLESDAQLDAVQMLARRRGVATPLLDALLPLLEQRALTGRC
jgi:2-dehydropantoate 2-reductase